MSGGAEAVSTRRRIWREVGIWLALIVLLAATLGLAYLPMGPGNAAVAMAISAAKLLLVALFYMHLRSARPLVRLAALAGLVFLAVMFALTLADVLFRLPPSWP